MVELIQNIPTNVITGFLGVGKTTAILHLLQQKPEQESWAVLVNEFGKIGIDGALIEQDGVTIKEVPGGCMCCAAGLSVQVGLNALLSRAKPDRLLIEPTGIGHPREIIRQLSKPPFDRVLNMQACITLIDPRHLQQSRYTENEYYKEQVDIADVLVANKIDQCNDQELDTFDRFVELHRPAESGKVRQGQLEPDWLALPHGQDTQLSILHAQIERPDEATPEEITLADGESCRREENQAGEFVSSGWLFADECLFGFNNLKTLFTALEADRIKASVKTDEGSMLFNVGSDGINFSPGSEATRNRIEIIRRGETDWDKIEKALLDCLL